MTARQLGGIGESLAAAYYRKKGYDILAANYRTRMGEIDLVVEAKQVLVFVEVKTRGSGAIAQPREWVDKSKQNKIRLAAQSYITAHYKEEPFVRFDVVEVLLSKNNQTKVQCIENAFE